MSEWIKIINDDGALHTINTQTVSDTVMQPNGMMTVYCLRGTFTGKYIGTDIVYGDAQDKFLTNLLRMIEDELDEAEEPTDGE